MKKWNAFNFFVSFLIPSVKYAISPQIRGEIANGFQSSEKKF